LIGVVELLQILANLSILIGVPFLFLEYRRRGKELGYQTYLEASRASMDLERLLIDNPRIREVLEGRANYEDVPQAENYFNMLMILFENVYLCWKKDWMEHDEWDGWVEWMRRMKRLEAFRRAWENERELYSRDFREFLEKLDS